MCVLGRVWLFATTCTVAHQAPPGKEKHGIFQARILQWVAISFSRGSSQPKDQTRISCVSCIGRWIFFFTTEPYGKQTRRWVSLCSVIQSCLTLCDPMNCSPSGSSVHGNVYHSPKSVCWSPSLQCDDIKGQSLWEISQVGLSLENGAPVMGLEFLYGEKRAETSFLPTLSLHLCLSPSPVWRQVRKQLFTSQEGGSHQNPTMPTPSSDTFSLQNYEKFLLFKPPKCMDFVTVAQYD